MRSIVEEENKTLVPSVEEEHPLGKEGPHDKNINYHDPFTILGVEVADILGMRGENEGTALWRVRMAQLGDEAMRERLKVEFGCAGERKVEEPKEEDTELKRSDYEAWVASQFRDEWTAQYSASYGSFDDTTRFGPMRFTDEPAPGYTAFPIGTLQDRYLVLTGPTRAIVWPTHVTIEVKLTLKGATESEDKDLSFLADPLFGRHVRYPDLFRRYKPSKLSTLEFTLGHIVDSVEATIFVRVIDGSCPDSRSGQFAAFSTTGVRDKDSRSIDRQKIVLLDSRGDKVLVTGDGEIELFTAVVSVETRGTLKVCVKLWKTSKSKRNVVEDECMGFHTSGSQEKQW
uniref:DUF6598 domain-containing protein n=1 Tax=Setaria viridis TaxID=4556 RepID=A0A4U6VZW3_SETVI|nr:hypothetical protein SEVIR_2G388100v2 [Setaria viridis]